MGMIALPTAAQPNPNIPMLSKRVLTPIAIGALFVAVVGAIHFLRGRLYFPHVVVEAQDNLKLEFLQEGVPGSEDCAAAAATIANTIRASCTACKIAIQQCPSQLAPELRTLLSQDPIGVPSSRLPRGVVAYVADNRDLALAACNESERLTTDAGGFRATCYPAGSSRALHDSSGRQARIEATQTTFGLLVLALAALGSAFMGFLIVRYETVHSTWSADPVRAGPQKFHVTPTPRIGGLALMAGLFVSGTVLPGAERGGTGEQFGYLLLASLPAVLGGITEDITKSVSVAVRLALTMLAALVGVWLLGAVIPRLDIPGFDTLLRWLPFAIAFTAFAVGGVANAINIIDGYNGLAAGHAMIVLAAMAWVSALVGDPFLMISALAMIGALLGFLAWNYPGGKVFLGDGGAYLLGFWLGELSVLLVMRHPEVSPWFPMLLLVYPIFETLYSMYRRKVVEGLSPGRPDRRHLHQVIYQRLRQNTPENTGDPAAATRLNNRVAPVSWLMTLACAVPALLFWKETSWLVAASISFCIAYLLFYRLMSK